MDWCMGKFYLETRVGGREIGKWKGKLGRGCERWTLWCGGKKQIHRFARNDRFSVRGRSSATHAPRLRAGTACRATTEGASKVSGGRDWRRCRGGFFVLSRT